MFDALNASITGRAQKAGQLELKTHNLRDWAINKHGQVDDVPFGGEAGMVLRPEPIKAALDAITSQLGQRPRVLYPSAQGPLFTQETAKKWTKEQNLLIICGHYKGIDQRVCDAFVDEEFCLGDYVLTGGELPAMVAIDTVARLLPGAIHDPSSAETDSFWLPHRLGWPVYTRPQVFEGATVPEVLTSGHHEKIRKWRILESLKLTRKNRPDLFARLISQSATQGLTKEEKDLLASEIQPEV